MEPTRKYIVGLYHVAFDLDRKDKTLIESSHEIFFDARPLLIDQNNPELFISPDFDWGSRSRGTKQAAISILLEVTDKYEAIRYADLLVGECLCLIPSHRNFSIQTYAIRRWLNSKKGLPNQETDLLFWTKIEEPVYRRPQPKPEPLEPEKKSLIIEPPPISKSIKTNGGKPMNRTHKYPFTDLEVGQYFYLISPSKEEIHKLGASQNERRKRLNREFIRRIVSAEWAREHGIPIAQDNIDVCIVWRTK